MHRQLLLAAVVWVSLAAASPAVEFPYTAYVTSDDVYIRSGPGKNYYPTAKLKRGAKVEIYRHDPGGWYAIRPPEESFSWVSARQVDPGENHLAEVNADRAVARVGSLFSEVREVIQVRLNKGERINLIDDEPSADGKWYKIAPPSGEFRWVYRDYLDRAPPDGEDVSEEDVDTEEDPNAATTARRKSRRSNDDIQLTAGESDTDSSELSPAARRRLKSRSKNEKSFAATLTDIDIDLSAMVAEETSVWSFDELRERGEQLLDRAPTAIERGQARLLLNKIDRFAQLQERQEMIGKLKDETTRRNRQLGTIIPLRHEESLGPRFDASGRLMPVVPRREGAPPFVLMDRAGQAVCYVTPAPGINLRPYVDRQVGLNGQRGFMSDIQKAHINAQHVTVLTSDVIRR